MQDNKLRIISLSKPLRTIQEVEAYITRQPIACTIPRNKNAAWWPVSVRKLVAFIGLREVSRAAVLRQNIIATTVDGLDAR